MSVPSLLALPTRDRRPDCCQHQTVFPGHTPLGPGRQGRSSCLGSLELSALQLRPTGGQGHASAVPEVTSRVGSVSLKVQLCPDASEKMPLAPGVDAGPPGRPLPRHPARPNRSQPPVAAIGPRHGDCHRRGPEAACGMAGATGALCSPVTPVSMVCSAPQPPPMRI